MTYFLSSAAAKELLEAIHFYKDNAGLAVAKAFIEEFERSVRLIVQYPHVGTPSLKDRRLLPLRRFPYSLIYRLADKRVQILAVAHQQKRPAYWKEREH